MGRKYKKSGISLLLCAVMFLGGCASIGTNRCVIDNDKSGKVYFKQSDSPDVYVNLGKQEGLPLIKKISQFTIGTDNLTNVADNARYLDDVNAPTMRYPLSIWGPDYSEKLIKYWTKYAYDTVGDIFSRNGTSIMYWHLAEVENAYNHEYESVGDVRYNPPVISAYANTWKVAAKYIREDLGKRAYFEILNECDHGQWYNGTWKEYVDIYSPVAKAIREGDPYAEVGGLAVSSVNKVLKNGGLDLFLDTVEAEKAPIDFVSYHNYSYSPGYDVDTMNLAMALDESEYFNQTQMHLNEFNVYWPEDVYSEKTGDDFLKTSAAVPLIFDAMEYFSQHPEITMVHWGTYSDHSEGLDLFTDEGDPLASYYALLIYQNMPVDRVQASSMRENVKVMASCDNEEAGVVMWNNGNNQEEISLVIEGIPAMDGTLEIYRIDTEHASVWENKSSVYEPVEVYENVAKEVLTWEGKIPAKGTVYIRWNSCNAEADRDEESQLGQVIRKNYYYADRSKNTYAEFDENTETVYMGMGDNDTGVGRCSVALKNAKETIEGKVTVTGDLSNSAEGTIGVRIDYCSGEAVYTKSVYFLVNGAEPAYEDFPWGTGKKAGTLLNANADNFIIPLKELAPENWNGEYMITFEILDMGADTSVKIEF